MSGRLLIVEEALRDGKAHWFSYIRTIARAATRRSMSVDVACHRHADDHVKSSFASFPIFDHSVYLDQHRKKLPGERYYSFLLHSYRTVRRVWPLLNRQARYDEVFVPTMLVQHVLAWWVISTLHPNRPKRVTLFFVATPGIWNAATGTTVMPRSSMLMKALLRLLSGKIRSNQVRLGVETLAAKSEYERLTALPFVLFPHPVEFASVPVDRCNEPPNFACYGFARHEKGSDLLATAIRQRSSGNAGPDVRFRIQWLEPFRMPDGTTCSPDAIGNIPGVEIIRHALNETEYLALLESTDCMLLPYRNSSYYARLSRVAIEASIMGIPMIYTRGGWLEEIATRLGAGIGIADESPGELQLALNEMKKRLPEYKQLAVAKSSAARDYYSGDRFIDILLT